MTAFAVTWASDAGSPEWSHPPATAGGWQVVADASLYYRADLRRRIPDAPPTDDASTLIALALAAGGPPAMEWLEGDFAFVAWHPGQRLFLAARDFLGRRPLYFSHHQNRLHVATDPVAILRDPTIPRGLDVVTLTTIAGGLWSHSDATAYAAVRELPAGQRLRWSPGTTPRVDRFWHPPDTIASRRQPLDEASDELRHLLEAAIRERAAPEGTTAIAMSGGWDSTAVYGTGCATGIPMHAISVSYPEGDRGREDEIVEQITRHWNTEPDFIPAYSIRMFDDWEVAARQRTLPFAHPFEGVNRALARRARALGATVMLDGAGGDALFQLSPIYLADLIRTGQWAEAFRQARAQAGDGQWVRTLYRWGIRPNLPNGVERTIGRLRGFPPARHYLDRPLPIWFRREFVVKHGVFQREYATRPPDIARSHILRESHAMLTYAFFPRAFAAVSQAVSSEGVELRSPLSDGRVVRFAVPRPWSDRIDRRETKLLLRRAMRDRLPASVLAPRPSKTGLAGDYFLAELRRTWPIVERLLPRMRLAELGIVDPAHFRRGFEYVLANNADDLAARVYPTLQVELWLQSHLA